MGRWTNADTFETLNVSETMTPPHRTSRPGPRPASSPKPETLREQNERLRQENERLRQQLIKQTQKLGEEQQRIADAERQIADLERQLGLSQQNSTTSSKPPSSDGLAGKQRRYA